MLSGSMAKPSLKDFINSRGNLHYDSPVFTSHLTKLDLRASTILQLGLIRHVMPSHVDPEYDVYEDDDGAVQAVDNAWKLLESVKMYWAALDNVNTPDPIHQRFLLAVMYKCLVFDVSDPSQELLTLSTILNMFENQLYVPDFMSEYYFDTLLRLRTQILLGQVNTKKYFVSDKIAGLFLEVPSHRDGLVYSDDLKKQFEEALVDRLDELRAGNQDFSIEECKQECLVLLAAIAVELNEQYPLSQLSRILEKGTPRHLYKRETLQESEAQEDPEERVIEQDEEEMMEERVTQEEEQEEMDDTVDNSREETPIQDTVDNSREETPMQDTVDNSREESPMQDTVDDSDEQVPMREEVELSKQEINLEKVIKKKYNLLTGHGLRYPTRDSSMLDNEMEWSQVRKGYVMSQMNLLDQGSKSLI